MIEKALFQKLSTTAAITALVGNRIYPVFLPEKTPVPAIVFLRVSTEGAAISHTKSSGKLTSFFEVGCYGKDIQVAKNLAKLVRSTLSGFSGTVAGLVIHRSEVQNEFDDYDFDTGLFTVPVEVALTHDEA